VSQLITVVVPARNAGAVLGGQLAALCAQTYEGEWEVLVADNGSSDDTAEVALAWAKRLPALRVLPASGTRGPGAARNAGARVAAGDLIAFCDADDRVMPGWLAACVRTLTNADVVAGATDITSLADPPEDETRYFHAGLFRFLPAGLGANLAVRRDAFLDLGGFDEAMRVGEDIDFCWRSQLAGLRYADAPDALVVKRVPITTAEILRKTFLYGRSDVALYRRYRAKGMPRELDRLVTVPTWLLRHPHFLLRTQSRRQWAWQGGTLAGRLAGSIEHRVLYP
jgi:glycosyltransferase involved in cell wall biosynthesis